MKSTSNNNFTRGDGLLEGFLAKKRAGKANKFIPQRHREGRIIDIGCGTYPFFLETCDFAEKYGIDPSLNIKAVRSKDLHLKKIVLSREKLPFKDNFFDVAVMLAVFEHLDYENIPSILAEVKRILKKGGVFIITTPAPWSDKLLHTIARWGLISSEEIHEHKHNHPKSKIVELLEKANFRRENISSGFFEAGLNMWFVAKK